MPDYPSLDKTWQYNVNQALTAQGSATACDKLVLYTIVNTLTTFGTKAWQVRGSSNATTASLIAVGAAGPGTGWGGTTDVNWAAGAGAHSWIVLRQTGLGNGAHPEILISCNLGTDQQIKIAWSPSAGFTGGSTTVDPTATDQFQIYGTSGPSFTNLGMGVDGTNRSYVIHVMMSDDGACTRIFVMYANSCTGYWHFEVPKNPISSGWTNPVIVGQEGTNAGTNQLTANAFYTNANAEYGVFNDGSAGSFYWSGELRNGALLNTVQTFANDLSSEWIMMPIGLYQNTLPGKRGRHGMWFDLWWGSTGVTFGQQYAGAGAHAFTQFGDMIFPWNGTVAVTA